jgi:hypothetical protein
LLIEYMLPSKHGEHVNPKLVRVLTSWLSKLREVTRKHVDCTWYSCF